MTPAENVALQTYVVELLQGRPTTATRPMQLLRCLAGQALRNHSPGGRATADQVEELVREFQCRTLAESVQARRPALAARWQAESPARAVGRIHTTMQRIVIDQAPDRKAYRRINEAVCRVMKQNRLPARAEFPESIERNRRTVQHLVAAACRAQISEAAPVKLTTEQLTVLLMERYHPSVQETSTSSEGVMARVEVEQCAEAHEATELEASELVRRFLAVAPDNGCLALASCGQDFRRLARTLNVGTSTAHNLYRSVLGLFQGIVSEVSTHRASVALAVDVIRARAAGLPA